MVRRPRQLAGRHRGQLRRRRDLDEAGHGDTSGRLTPARQARKTEPSAFGISVRPDAATTSSSGRTAASRGARTPARRGRSSTRRREPRPATSGTSLRRAAATIDICGDDGHLRSTDSGTNWTADPGCGHPARAAARSRSRPDESYVLFVVASDDNVYETDDAGANWTNHGSNGAQGRIPFVETNQRSERRQEQPVHALVHGHAAVPRRLHDADPPAQGGAARCGNTSGYTQPADRRALGRRGDLVFDSAVAVDSCPMIYLLGRRRAPPDGRAVRARPGRARTSASTRSSSGPSTAPDQGGNTNEDLLYGLQDNGHVREHERRRRDPDVDEPELLRHVRRPRRLGLGARQHLLLQQRHASTGSSAPAPGYAGNARDQHVPGAGNLGGFTWGHRLAQFGTDDVALIITAGIYVTKNINANPIVWSALAAMPGRRRGLRDPGLGQRRQRRRSSSGPASARGAETTRSSRTPGISDAGTWTRIDNTDGLTGGLGIVAVDPSNPNNLYASNLLAGGPQMVFSTDGGANWTNDPELDTLMTANGAFLYQNKRGASTNRGGAGANFQGYLQPSAARLRRRRTGASSSRAARTPASSSPSTAARTGASSPTRAASASRICPRPRDAYFDHEPVTQLSIYLFTQGRGVWRLTFQLPTARAGGPYIDARGHRRRPRRERIDRPGRRPTHVRVGLRQRRAVRRRDRRQPDLHGWSARTASSRSAVKATDPDGGYDTDSRTVNVTNVAPTRRTT